MAHQHKARKGGHDSHAGSSNEDGGGGREGLRWDVDHRRQLALYCDIDEIDLQPTYFGLLSMPLPSETPT